MVGRGTTGTGYWDWWVGANASGTVATFGLDSDGSTYTEAKGTTSIYDGDWHHIAAVRDASHG